MTRNSGQIEPAHSSLRPLSMGRISSCWRHCLDSDRATALLQCWHWRLSQPPRCETECGASSFGYHRSRRTVAAGRGYQVICRKPEVFLKSLVDRIEESFVLSDWPAKRTPKVILLQLRDLRAIKEIPRI